MPQLVFHAIAILTFGLSGGSPESQSTGLPTVELERFRSSSIPFTGPGGGVEIVDQPVGDPTTGSFFFDDQQGSFTIAVILDQPSTQDLQVEYLLGGTATEGVDYTIDATYASPITIPAGDTRAHLEVQVTPRVEYFTQKRLNIRLQSGQPGMLIHSLHSELHAYIRSTTTPPSIEFARDRSTARAGHVHLIGVRKQVGAPHESDVRLHLRIDPSSTAVEGVDYRFQHVDALHGRMRISPSMNALDLPVEFLADATPGRTLTLNLHHEQSDGSQANRWTHTHSFEFGSDGASKPAFPAEPSDHAPGPLSALPRSPVVVGKDALLQDPLGFPLPVLKLRDDADHFGYLRKDSTAQLHCAGTPTLHPQSAYTRVSLYVRKASDLDLPRYFRLQWRDRGFSVAPPQRNAAEQENHFVVFDTQFTGPGGTTYEGNTWGIAQTTNMRPGSDWGITTESHRMVDGTTEELLRLWMTYHEDRPEHLGQASNILIYPAFMVAGSDTDQVLLDSRGKGLCVFDLYHELSDTPLTGPPPSYFPRPGMAWEPLGGAVLPESLDAFTQHTILVVPPTSELGTVACGPGVPNSLGTSGEIRAYGSDLASIAQLDLCYFGLPPGEATFLLMGLEPDTIHPVGSQGILCMRGTIARFNQVSDLHHGPSGCFRPDLTHVPTTPQRAVAPGDTWIFQCWYRDPSPTTSNNFTNALEIEFQ